MEKIELGLDILIGHVGMFTREGENEDGFPVPPNHFISNPINISR